MEWHKEILTTLSIRESAKIVTYWKRQKPGFSIQPKEKVAIVSLGIWTRQPAKESEAATKGQKQIGFEFVY